MKQKNKTLLLVSLLVYIQISLTIILIVLLYSFSNKMFDNKFSQCSLEVKKELSVLPEDPEVRVQVDDRYNFTQARYLIENSGYKVKNVDWRSDVNTRDYSIDYTGETNPEKVVCSLKELAGIKAVTLLPNPQISSL